MKTFILAGGEGTRLRPYTYNTPKPMLMVGGKPILQYVIDNLKRAGLKDLIITCGYKHEQITSYFGDGSKFGVKMEYAIEKEKMNTAGSILPYKGKVKESFVVVMGDHLTNIDMTEMVKSHKKSGAMATIALYRSSLPLEYGVAKTEGGNVTGFTEKPLLAHLYNTAIYVFEPEIFDYIKDKEDFAKDVFPRLLASKKKINAYVFDDVWFDIGRISDYERLDELFKVIKLAEDLKS
ncbi:nucleotidyltransferase family protein [Candidatus Micrarchaeota archaeon]|nr:nucleotidyltransferase family protein [Candidatus Micrarchaeota archaeon]